MDDLAQRLSSRVISAKLDVTDQDSIKKAATGADSKLGGEA